MRQRLFALGRVLLVVVAVLTALAGCARDYEARGPETGERAGTETGVEATPGATVISAATPRPGGTGQVSTGTNATAVVIVLSSPTAVLASPVAPQPTGSPTSPEAPFVIHTVVSGDTLISLATRYGVSVAQIVEANELPDANAILSVGQELKIPVVSTTPTPEPVVPTAAPTAKPPAACGVASSRAGCRWDYTVQAGDWIWKIGRRCGVEGQAILDANGLTAQTGQWIYPGQVLCIP